ncbi:MAG TPA: cupredoxin domain-containing protein [Candidatus Limnocylindria bacterium]|nr:cupredoxin domain-containing protein [Candidatus Limnocylindria bacterium]
MSAIARLSAFAILALAVACGGAAGPAPATQARQVTIGATVTYKSFAVSPTAVEIARGQAVQWKNEDSTQHTVSGGRPGAKGPFDQKVGGGATTQVVFETAGTFDYFCEFHPSMTGKVTVR